MKTKVLISIASKPNTHTSNQKINCFKSFVRTKTLPQKTFIHFLHFLKKQVVQGK